MLSGVATEKKKPSHSCDFDNSSATPNSLYLFWYRAGNGELSRRFISLHFGVEKFFIYIIFFRKKMSHFRFFRHIKLNKYVRKIHERSKQEEYKTAHFSPSDYETKNIVSSSDGVSCDEKNETNFN